MSKIVGIDLSLTGTGLVILKNGKVDFNQLITSKKNGDSPLSEFERLDGIITNIGRQLFVHKPIDLVVTEGLAFMARNTTALVQLSGLNYLLRNFIYLNQEELGMKQYMVVVAPTTLKKFITGKGNSAKDVMLLEVYKKYGVSYTEDNQCDAFSLAKTGEAMMSKKMKLNKTQQEVVNLLNKQKLCPTTGKSK